MYVIHNINDEIRMTVDTQNDLLKIIIDLEESNKYYYVTMDGKPTRPKNYGWSKDEKIKFPHWMI